MYPVSTVYKEKIQENSRTFSLRIEIEHSAGVLSLTDKDIVNNTLIYSEGTQSGEEFTIGGTVASDLTIEILNRPEYEGIKFMGATVKADVGLLISSVDDNTYFMQASQPINFIDEDLYEYVPLGRFNTDDDNIQRNTIKLKAMDNMIKFDLPYGLSKLSYPATLYQIYVNACNVADVNVGTPTFPNMSHVVQKKPEGDLTFRDVVGYVAELSGTFAKCNRNGALELMWYKSSGVTIGPANRFNFIPRDDLVQIKGIMATVGDTTYLAGTDDYAIDLSDNPLLQDGYETVLPNIFNNVKDTVFTPYESPWQGNPAMEAGDMITQIDRDGKLISTLITNSTYKYRGSSTLSAKGLPEISKGYKGSTNKKMANIIRKVEKEVGDRLTTIEQAQLEATELIANMLGGHIVKDDINGIIYIADNPNIDLAVKVWKYGINGFGYSENGVGGPYNTAITADGSIVAMLVAANIITANMVQTGLLQSEDGSTWINLDTGEFNFKDILKYVGGVFNKIDAAYINATSLSALSANLGTVTSGSITGAAIKTSETGARVELTSDLLNVYDSSNRSVMKFLKVDQINQDGRVVFYNSGTKIGAIGAIRDAFTLSSYDSWGGMSTLIELLTNESKFYVSGKFTATGTKAATVYTDNYGVRELYAVENPEVKFEDEGLGELIDGYCRIQLDPIFIDTIENNTEETPYIVHLTPYDWLNIRIKEVGNDYFTVEEKENLSGKFSWKLTATRLGCRGIRLTSVAETRELLDDNWEDEIESNFIETLERNTKELLNDNWEVSYGQ